ncbi:MAG: hypothetical protein KAS32_13620 [Candidatus Peribacteraceae bacterium]|nr:hypothetical protein [Candidatus Peribacteraceae bacterium]
MTITPGYSGDIEWVLESAYGTTPSAQQLQIPADAVIRCHLDINREVKRHYGITSHSAVDTTYHTKAYTLSLEYELQLLKTTGAQHNVDETLGYHATHRTAGDLDSLSIYFEAGTEAFLLKGGLVNKYSWDCSQDNAIHVTVEIIGNAVETGANLAALTNYTGQTASAAIATAIEIFEGSAITRSGKWAEGIKSGSFSIDNQVERLFKAGSSEAVSVKPKFTVSEGATLVYASDGGKTPVDDILSGDEVAIVFASGTTSSESHEFTFGNASYNAVPVVYETGMTGMSVDLKWGAESVAFAAVT